MAALPHAITKSENDLAASRLPVVQEAAILFCASFTSAAIAVLKEELRSATGKGNRQAWLALFDLYQATNNQAEFDALSMLFTVKFEQSPPVWTVNTSVDARRGVSKERKDIYVLKDGAEGGDVAKMEAFVNGVGSVKVDLSKVTEIPSDQIQELTRALQRSRKRNLSIWITGADKYDALMRRYLNECDASSQGPFWAALFELFILLGKSEEFENLGIEFAVAMEMSPPNWETYVNKIAAVAAADKAAKPANDSNASPTRDGFKFRSVLSSASTDQLDALTQYASGRFDELSIDMGFVTKIEYGFFPALLVSLRALATPSRRVLLVNANEIVAASIESFNFNKYVIVLRRKSI